MKAIRILSALLCLTLLLGIGTTSLAEEPLTFRLFMVVWGEPPAAMDEVVEAINTKLLGDGMDFQLEFNYVNAEVWETKLNMMLNTGESFGAFIVMQDWIPWSTYQARGAIQPVTQFIDEYGEHLKQCIPESVFKAITSDAEVWGIPSYGSSISSNSEWITVRTDLVDQYCDGKMPETNSELLEYIKAVYEGCGGQAWPKIVTDGGSYLHRDYDSYPFTVFNEAIYIDKDGNAKAWIDTDEFRKDAEFWHTCYVNGWTDPDILTLSDYVGREAQFTDQNGSVRADINTSAITREELEANVPGADLEAILLRPELGYFNATGLNHCWLVPVTAEHPELAVRFFDWLYTSQENHDLLVYGVEGKHWVETDESISYGDVTRKCIEVIRDEVGNPLYSSDFWALGNLNYKRYTTSNLSSMMNTDMHINYGDLPEIEGAALGFVFDPTNVETEWVNIQAEIASSIYPIKYGIVAYEDGFEDMRARFTAAGIDKVVEEYQRQLNVFLGK